VRSIVVLLIAYYQHHCFLVDMCWWKVRETMKAAKKQTTYTAMSQ